MCTAATLLTKDFYFGRTLDYDVSYGGEVTVTPRGYPFRFRHMGELRTHYAIIGMARVAGGYPLYFDAVNEKGLGIAGLNFVGNAVYPDPEPGTDIVAQFELIPWLLGRCASVGDARARLKNLRIVSTPFSPQLPPAQLHWLIADRTGAIVVEQTKTGLHVYDDPVGVLTNNPPFEEQLLRLNDYMGLSPRAPVNNFSRKLDLKPYGRGMGAIGLPGDLSSPSRFVRAAFVRMNSVCGDSEAKSVSQFFHILGAVDQQRGCCEVEDGKYEITLYTSCCNADRGIYYYTTYDNHQITGVDMNREDLDGSALVRYPLIQGEQIRMQN